MAETPDLEILLKTAADTAGVDKVRSALEKLASDAKAFRRKLDEVATVEDKLKAATELSIALLQERAREQDAERSSELALKKAEIDAKSRAGLVSELDALKQKNDLENQFAREKIER